MSATRALISVEEYLATSYRPDCDYVDGEVVERNLGEQDHSWLQAALGSYFFVRRKEWNVGRSSRNSGYSQTLLQLFAFPDLWV